MDETKRAHVVAYFEDFVQALTAYLRPHRGRLNDSWLGLDRSKRTLLLRFSPVGFTAIVTGTWLDSPVRVKDDATAGRLLTGRFKDVHHPPGTRGTFWFGINRFAGDGKARITLDMQDNLRIELESAESSLGFVGLQYFGGLSPEQVAALGQYPFEARIAELGLRPARPPWVVGIVSNVSSNALSGLDTDPLIAARGVADAILSFSGIVSDPVARYTKAAEELRLAVLALSSGNEAGLQQLLEQHPWILLHESEYDHVLFRPRLEFSERLASQALADRLIVPDFVYHLPDSESLVVEIESASKRLLLAGAETTYKKPAATAAAAMFQIANYRQLFGGYAGSQLRQALERPDAWSFKYLLVVGSRSQPDFDERSWINLRDHLSPSGIVLRTWDYYIDLLERRAAAARFSPGA